MSLAHAQTYVGMPYIAGQFDCADLAVRVQNELFGKRIALPDNHKGGARGQFVQINGLKDELAQRINEPQNGCGVLMTQYTGRSILWHIGTVFLDGQDIWVLHNSALQKSAALQRLEMMRRSGFRVEGYYQWK
jgi:hypothetical protein